MKPVAMAFKIHIGHSRCCCRFVLFGSANVQFSLPSALNKVLVSLGRRECLLFIALCHASSDLGDTILVFSSDEETMTGVFEALWIVLSEVLACF